MPQMPLDPRLHAYRPDLADARLAGRVEARRFVAGRPATILAPAAALRRRPAPDAPLDSEALHGETVTVFDTTAEGWCWVQLDRDSYVGYVEAGGLGEAMSVATHRLDVPRSFVYPLPDIKAPPRSWLPLGARFAARARDQRFLALDRGGFVIAAHASPRDRAAADFVAVAEAFLAVPYLWGGRTGLGLDCSGLVQIALDAAGLAAPRDSDQQQATLGTALPAGAALRRGDLVFWPGHVGVMRDDRMLLHANGHHMQVASEPLADAAARIAARGGGAIAMIKRL